MIDHSKLALLLEEHREALRAFLHRQVGLRLLRYESIEDLIAGIHTEAIRQAPRFQYRGPAEFGAWVLTIARNHVLTRAAHWNALKRQSGGLLRLGEGETGGVSPPSPVDSPSSFASQREELLLVTRAMATLRPRDRNILGRIAQGATIDDLADELAIAYDAARLAKNRALERLRKAVRIATKNG